MKRLLINFQQWSQARVHPQPQTLKPHNEQNTVSNLGNGNYISYSIEHLRKRARLLTVDT